MGVDVVLVAENKNGLTQEELKLVNEAINREGTAWGDNFRIIENEKYIEFGTVKRYYGFSYERGPWADISGTINILRVLSGGKVFYYPDSDYPNDWSNAKEFTVADQRKLDEHFAVNGNEPYRAFFRKKEIK